MRPFNPYKFQSGGHSTDSRHEFISEQFWT